MKKQSLLLASVLALLASCQNGNKADNNNAENIHATCTAAAAWPVLDQEGNYVRQEGDPIFLVSDKFRKQFIHPTATNDTIANANEYSKFLWKDFVLKIATGEFISGNDANQAVPEEFESLRGPLFVPIDQEETIKLSKQMNTQWFDLIPVAFTEKGLENRSIYSFSDKKSTNDNRDMEDSVKTKIAEKYGLEIEHSEWIGDINHSPASLYQVQFKAKDEKVTIAMVAFLEDGSFVTYDESLDSSECKSLKSTPIISCVMKTDRGDIEIYYVEKSDDLIATGIYIVRGEKLEKVRMNVWPARQ